MNNVDTQKELFRLAKKHHCLLDLLWRNGLVWNGCWWGMGIEFKVRANTYNQMIRKLYAKVRRTYE